MKKDRRIKTETVGSLGESLTPYGLAEKSRGRRKGKERQEISPLVSRCPSIQTKNRRGGQAMREEGLQVLLN